MDKQQILAAYRELERRIAALESENARTRALMSGHDLGAAYIKTLALTNIRGFWPMNNPSDGSGAMYDLSGHTRTLTWGAGANVGEYNSRILYAEFNGSTAYLLRASEAGFNTTTTPITAGGWFWHDTATANQALIGKFNATGAQRSWIIQMLNGSPDIWRVIISTDGAASVVCNSAETVTTGAWHHIVMRYTPSTELNIFVNGVKASNTTSIPASLFSSTSDFRIGLQGGGIEFLDGRAAWCFFCGNDIPDIMLKELYEAQAPFFQA